MPHNKEDTEKILLQAKVIAIGEEVEPSNDIYISLKMVFLTSDLNLNNIQFTKDWINGIVEQKDKYIGLPLVADAFALESGQYKRLTHLFDKKTNKFKTQAIGSFYNFETGENNGITELIAYARIWKRNAKICSALQELYESEEGLSFSYEVLVGKYSVDGEKKIIDKDEVNVPIGSCVVSYPAVPASKAQLLIAEAYKHDFIDGSEAENGSLKIERTKDMTEEQFFANVNLSVFEKAELDFTQIRIKIWEYVVGAFEDFYNWDIVDVNTKYFVLMSYLTGDYYKIDYITNDNEIIFSPITKVSKEYIEISEGERKEMEIKELETKVAELEKSIADKDAIIATKDTEIAQKSQELETKQNEIAEKDKQIETLSASVIEKDNAIKELEPYKAEVEKINAEKAEVEKAEKKIAIKEKYSKLLSAEILAETEIASAIENLDEKVLNERVVKYALEKAEKDKSRKPVITTATRIIDNMPINGNSVVDKYITINK